MRAVWQVCVRLSGEAAPRKHSASTPHRGAGAKPEQWRCRFQNKTNLQNFHLAALEDVYANLNKQIPFSPLDLNEDYVWNIPHHTGVNIQYYTTIGCYYCAWFPNKWRHVFRPFTKVKVAKQHHENIPFHSKSKFCVQVQRKHQQNVYEKNGNTYVDWPLSKSFIIRLYIIFETE